DPGARAPAGRPAGHRARAAAADRARGGRGPGQVVPSAPGGAPVASTDGDGAANVTVPAAPSTVITCPVVMSRVASRTQMTAGMPYSRATVGPCAIAAPVSVTRPPAVMNSGVQPGSVVGATRISPGSTCAPAGS